MAGYLTTAQITAMMSCCCGLKSLSVAIREAAIANAKLALEENLTEGVKEMLAEKLKAL